MTARHLSATPGPAEAIAATFAACVPHLDTERTRLRAPRLGDFDAYRQIVGSERGRHMGGPMDDEAAWFDFISLSSCWMLHGHGGWSVEDRRTGELLGFVLLGLEPGDRDVELGFLFLETAEGQGYAFESAVAVRDWAFRELRLASLDSYVAAANTRSQALARRLGATDETPADWDDADTRVFRHRNPGARS
jgi:RimJ/RimL family protein N-acetyltransferase